MNILLVTATELEIGSLLAELSFKTKKSPFLSTYGIGEHTVDVLISGIGMVATAYQLGKCLATESYDFALNLGIAGSFANHYPEVQDSLGDVVNVISDRIAELGVMEGKGFTCMSDLGLMQQSDLSFTTSRKACDKTAVTKFHESPLVQSLRQVSGITVNRLDTGEEEIKTVVYRLKPDVETMEGAAFLNATFQENIPCLQLRSLSNYVGERNKKNWKMEESLAHLNNTALQLLRL